MTFNWLCNTAEMSGVHNLSLVVALDQETAWEIGTRWPNLALLEWIVPGLKDPFNYGDGHYQLFYLFRSNLAEALLEMNRTFWMIQQDTFWSNSLSFISIESSQWDIIFDRASEHGTLAAGGYYGTKPTEGSKKYFAKLSRDLAYWYVPDNAYMTSLCELSGLAKCGHLPFSLITNWQWLDGVRGQNPPNFIQFDGETKLGGKLAKMAKGNLERRISSTSFSQQQFKFYQNIVDILYSNPATRWLLNRWILPYAHFCMLSL